MRTPKRRSTAGVALGLAVAAGSSGAAQAESLADAIALAYQTNPQILAQRAELKAVNERYIQARGAMGPSLALSAQTSQNTSTVYAPKSLFNPSTQTHYGWYSSTGVRVNFTQPLNSSGQLSLAVSAAEADILAARQGLQEQQASVLGDVITAYADVVLNRILLTIAEQNIALLKDQAAEIQAKFNLKEATLTDQSQTRARLIAAEIGRERAASTLATSEAHYLAVVGHAPGELEALPELPGLPATAEQAFDAADAYNPTLLVALYTARASHLRVGEAKAGDGFQVTVNGSYGDEPYTNYLRNQHLRSYEATISVNRPLYTAGIHSSRIRQSLETANRDDYKTDDIRRRVVQTVARAWSEMASRRRVLDELQTQLKQEESAFRGSRIEARNGLRQTIDVLNAEQEYQSTKVALFQSFHDEYLTEMGLLLSVGLLNVDLVSPATPVYRPEAPLKTVLAEARAPWVGPVTMLDRIGAPRVTVAGLKLAPPAPGDRPSEADTMPVAPRWRELEPYLKAPSFDPAEGR
jgi:TolC family type I secretion outer membrane protein